MKKGNIPKFKEYENKVKTSNGTKKIRFWLMAKLYFLLWIAFAFLTKWQFTTVLLLNGTSYFVDSSSFRITAGVITIIYGMTRVIDAKVDLDGDGR